MQKPPALQDDIKLESLLIWLKSAICCKRCMVIGNLCNAKYVEENSQNTHSN